MNGERMIRGTFCREMLRFFTILSVLALFSCSAHRFDYRLPVDSSQAPGMLALEFMEQDRQDSREVQEALHRAMEKVSRWGELRYPATISVFPDHTSLLAAVHRFGLDWLRGWARFDTVYIQSPRTWQIPDRRERLEELLTHELAHVLTYQRASTPENWRDLRLPFWFREGFASVVAEQGARRGTKEHAKSYYLSEDFSGDPLVRPETVVASRPEMAYAVAHWIFHDLLERVGKERILAVLDEMREGKGFRRAFHLATGMYADNWVEDWRDSLVLETPQESQEKPSPDVAPSATPENFNAVPDMGPVNPGKES